MQAATELPHVVATVVLILSKYKWYSLPKKGKTKWDEVSKRTERRKVGLVMKSSKTHQVSKIRRLEGFRAHGEQHEQEEEQRGTVSINSNRTQGQFQDQYTPLSLVHQSPHSCSCINSVSENASSLSLPTGSLLSLSSRCNAQHVFPNGRLRTLEASFSRCSETWGKVMKPLLLFHPLSW